MQKELDGRYQGENVQFYAISTGDPDWYMRAFKEQMGSKFPWLLLDINLPNPYYQEIFDLYGLHEDYPTLFLLDHNGVIRFRDFGGNTAGKELDYRGAFDLIGTLLQEAKATQTADIEQGWEVGQQALGFSLNDVNGVPYALSDYLGKTVLLSFWGTGCADCGDLVPGIYAQEIRERYGNPEDFVILGIDYYTPADFLTQFIRQMKVEYPVLVDPKGEVFSAYRIADEFLFIVIDPQGTIRYRERELEGDIYGVLDELLQLHASDGVVAGAPVGSAAADFRLLDMFGEEVHLADFLGEVVVLGFFDSEQGICSTILPELNDIDYDYKDAVVLAVDVRAKASFDLDEAKRVFGINFPLLVEGDQVAIAYDMINTGAILIDREGVIRARDIGSISKEFRALLATLLNE